MRNTQSVVKRYAMRPISVAAMEWDGSEGRLAELREWGCNCEPVFKKRKQDGWKLLVKTSFGSAVCGPRDMILKDDDGGFHVCGRAVFDSTYEEIR